MEGNSNIRVVSVADTPWQDVQAVFGTRGDPSTCWCQFFKMNKADWKEASRATCEPLLAEQVRELDPPPGVIAYLGDEPVGWSAVEPRRNYPELHRTRVAADPDPADDPSIWSVTCFVVRVGFRKKGIATALLAGAIEQARAHGATVLEGYPVDPTAREKVASADLYYGIVSQFLANGFTEVSRPKPDRALMRLNLTI
ncbi:GNAT superfamily N-acetyltransferase [Okibacterium sp. HSC-33S16]|uniref:GNAT family N-acetyltransferase n=1 Tax=Okibacterium sp. HSC-33S16 TaxID=2910965 RepID=UPI00209E25C3|nr:GNAT family N-acetyltransferase [Okibacterium sp. HSC-33S16]MCP2032573.1 GNAT superfamily N-acetyltransferase [Okibacterium sp. HSC-33S16]